MHTKDMQVSFPYYGPQKPQYNYCLSLFMLSMGYFTPKWKLCH